MTTYIAGIGIVYLLAIIVRGEFFAVGDILSLTNSKYLYMICITGQFNRVYRGLN